MTIEQALLTVNELATYLSVSRSTVYRFVNEGQIRTVQVGDRMRFRPEDVDAFLERCRRNAST